uniref:2-amino-3-carboxymuconate-6-semialdehyde decarboxylase n=1 Tax=Mucochytrium quahogii TaxID=96639 RepID=A0A7S2RYQ4_9STRA|mmetsp:Transcript_16454/g.28524  ORF Transcript_16454/g.28524 Transcript_16454/m.28524 type:complete len:367 (+) Transcript_16454:109-1209(+)
MSSGARASSARGWRGLLGDVGEGVKVDFHTHLIPKSWPDFSRRYGYPGFVHIDHSQEHVEADGNARLVRDSEMYFEVGPNCWDLERRIVDMDAAGIDIQVVSTIPELFSYWAKGDDAADLARILNNDMSEQIALHGNDRFIGLGTVPLQAPELAVAELQRCMCELGFAGVIIGTHINEWSLDAPELIPFWEAAEDLGACILVHPNNLETKGRDDKYLVAKVCGIGAEICHGVTCFLTAGILDKFPLLKVCFAYGGGSFPYVRGEIEHGLRNASSQEGFANAVSKDMYFGKFYCDSIVRTPESRKFLLETMQEENVVFGSDYPAPLGEFSASSRTEKYHAAGKAVFSDYSESTRKKLFSENARRLLE